MLRVAATLVLILLQAGSVPPTPPLTVVSSRALHAAPVPATLLRWLPSAITCGGAPVSATVRRPYSGLFIPDQSMQDEQLRFDIDARGRAIGIAHVGAPPKMLWHPARQDIVPSLAGSDLSAARGKSDCRITYRTESVSMDQAPVPDLISYSIHPLNGRLPETGWSRIRGGEDDCIREPRAPWQTRVTPDWRNLPRSPGAPDWVLLGYEMSGEGRPQKIRVVSSSGDRNVEKAGIAALDKSRLLTDGPRRACLDRYVRPAARLMAPDAPDRATLRPAGSNCPDDADWARSPSLTFPEPFRRRAIEGWAVVAYDVAPWGAIGNLRVLASQPATAFGDAALNLLRNAQRKPVATGYQGCVDTVHFRMGDSLLD